MGSLPDAENKQASKWSFVDVDAYSSAEQNILVQHAPSKSVEQTRELVKALNGDPFLCGLALNDITPMPGVSRSALIRDVFELTINKATKAAPDAKDIPATPGEFANALDCLVGLILRIESPEPTWQQIRSKLNERDANLLYVLAKTNLLGWIDKINDKEVWRWKHSRLRDAIIGRWFAANVLSQLDQGIDQLAFSAWLTNPGLAEAWALALVFCRNSVRLSAIALLAANQPLALAEVLRLRLFPNEANIRANIRDGLHQVLADFRAERSGFVNGLEWHLATKLLQTDDAIVIEITYDLEPAWYIWAARLRNGDISAGLSWLELETQHYRFLPSGGFRQLEEQIESLAKFYEAKREKLVDELANAVHNPILRLAALTLAGYIAWPELGPVVVAAWNAAHPTERQTCLTYFVWSLSRCGSETTQPTLETALLMVRNISDAEEEGKSSRRYFEFMSPLHSTLRWPITEAAADTWTRVAENYPDMRKTMCYLLRHVDHPNAIETFIRWSVQQGAYLWNDNMEFVDPLTELKISPYAPVKTVTRERLWHLIVTDDNIDVRFIAFSSWKRKATSDDLIHLQSVSEQDKLFDESLKVRLKLRDQTAASLLVERIKQSPGKWCAYASLLCNHSEVRQALEGNIEKALESPPFYSHFVFRYLPADAVREFVLNKPELLMRSRQTWISLWRSDVPEALTFVQQAISQEGLDELHYFFSMYTEGGEYPVSQSMLDSLLPVLERFTASEKEELAELAVNSGFSEWVEEHLLETVKSERCWHFWLRPDEVPDVLSKAAQSVPSGYTEVLYSGFSRIQRKGLPTSDILQLVQAWLGTSASPEQLIVAAMMMAAHGRANHIDWWKSVEPDMPKVHKEWQNALYAVQRRHWQS